MKTKILFLAFLALFFSNSNAETWSYCKNVSAQVSNLPMNVDRFDKFCLPTKYGPEFNYKYTVDDSILYLQKRCLRFSYYQINGNFVGVVSFSYKDCK